MSASNYLTRQQHRREYRSVDASAAQWREHVESCVPCATEEVEKAQANVVRQDYYSANGQAQKAARSRLKTAERRLAKAEDLAAEPGMSRAHAEALVRRAALLLFEHETNVPANEGLLSGEGWAELRVALQVVK